MRTAEAELVFIPTPGMGHLIPAVEFSKRLIEQDQRISITFLIYELPSYPITPFIDLLKTEAAINERINFLELPKLKNPVDVSSTSFVDQTIEDYKPIVKQVVQDQFIGGMRSLSSTCPDSERRLTGFILDLLCTTMVDVANEFNVPSYVFFTSGASLLSLMFHFQSLRDHHGVDVADLFKDPDSEFDIPGFKNRVPVSVLPAVLLDEEAGSSRSTILNYAKRYRETKGIIVNTFMELESDAILSLLENVSIPPIYPVGPIIKLNSENDEGNKSHSVMTWLDNQPPSSVVFLCFGSMGCFGVEQVKEVAEGLKRSEHRFLWSLRRPTTSEEKVGPPRDYENLDDVLPNGFLDQTNNIGRVIGWAPQIEVLSHPAIGGFVSHCGWNSTLESLWFGIPVAAWPMYAEQQLNAFQMVRELELATEIRMNYRWDNRKKMSNGLVEAKEIEKGIRNVMDSSSRISSNVKQMSNVSKKTAMNGESSYTWMDRFVEDVFDNVAM